MSVIINPAMSLKKIIPSLLLSLIFSGCTIPFFTKEQAALQIEASPEASVYINGTHIGKTPIKEQKLKPGEYTIRLLVDDDPTKDWQTKMNLASGIVSVINKTFGATTAASANYFLQLEPLSNKEAIDLVILTIPDNVVVKVNDLPQGFSPVSLKDIKDGEQRINLTAPGYQEMNLTVFTKLGYKLVVSAQMAQLLETITPDQEASPGADLVPSDTATTSASVTPSITSSTTPATTPSPTPARSTTSGELAPPYVIIKETGTGWLRVRENPSGTSDNEVARVNVGDKLPFLESSQTGWYKIEYETGKEGWVSAQYAQLVR
jgi:hypothetical protein